MAKTKLKTHRGAAKRFKLTGKKKVVRNPVGRRHLLTCKSKKRKRKLRKRNVPLTATDQRTIRQLLPYA